MTWLRRLSTCFGAWPHWAHPSRPFMGPICLGRNHSQVYPHMRAQFGHDRSSRLAAYTRQTDTHTHARTHARTHTHTQNLYIIDVDVNVIIAIQRPFKSYVVLTRFMGIGHPNVLVINANNGEPYIFITH